MRRAFIVSVWFRITLTTFLARITTVHLYLSKLYLKHYWFHFFRTRFRLLSGDNRSKLFFWLLTVNVCFCRFWFFKILIIIGVIIGAFFIKDPTFDKGKFFTVILVSACWLIGYYSFYYMTLFWHSICYGSVSIRQCIHYKITHKQVGCQIYLCDT